MIRKQAFLHFNQQPFKDWTDTITALAPEVEVAQSSERDVHNDRVSEVSWINSTEDSQSLFQFIWEMQDAGNKDAEWKFDVDIIEPLQYTQYDGEKEQRYDWHVDHRIDEVEESIRKLSFTILLDGEFEGGEFEIEAGSPGTPERIHTVDLKPGDAVLFPSYMWHRVKPVTSGTRRSLVGWVIVPQWR